MGRTAGGRKKRWIAAAAARIAGGVMEKYPWDERGQNPEQARREAWRCIRWLVVGWGLLFLGGWAVLEVL